MTDPIRVVACKNCSSFIPVDVIKEKCECGLNTETRMARTVIRAIAFVLTLLMVLSFVDCAWSSHQETVRVKTFCNEYELVPYVDPLTGNTKVRVNKRALDPLPDAPKKEEKKP